MTGFDILITSCVGLFSWSNVIDHFLFPAQDVCRSATSSSQEHTPSMAELAPTFTTLAVNFTEGFKLKIRKRGGPARPAGPPGGPGVGGRPDLSHDQRSRVESGATACHRLPAA